MTPWPHSLRSWSGSPNRGICPRTSLSALGPSSWHLLGRIRRPDRLTTGWRRSTPGHDRSVTTEAHLRRRRRPHHAVRSSRTRLGHRAFSSTDSPADEDDDRTLASYLRMYVSTADDEDAELDVVDEVAVTLGLVQDDDVDELIGWVLATVNDIYSAHQPEDAASLAALVMAELRADLTTELQDLAKRLSRSGWSLDPHGDQPLDDLISQIAGMLSQARVSLERSSGD
jgi:hypothetical protein